MTAKKISFINSDGFHDFYDSHTSLLFRKNALDLPFLLTTIQALLPACRISAFMEVSVVMEFDKWHNNSALFCTAKDNFPC